jgi:hypothetical protein
MVYLDEKPLARSRRPARLRELNPEAHVSRREFRAHKGPYVHSSPTTMGLTCPKAFALPTLHAGGARPHGARRHVAGDNEGTSRRRLLHACRTRAGPPAAHGHRLGRRPVQQPAVGLPEFP